MITTERPLAGDALQFDLDQEAIELLDGIRHDRAARTLVKDGSLRVAMIVLKPGGSIPEHKADGPVTIVPLVGVIRVETPDSQHQLEMPGLLALGAGVPHDVSSETGGAFLLTIVGGGRPEPVRVEAVLDSTLVPPAGRPRGVHLGA